MSRGFLCRSLLLACSSVTSVLALNPPRVSAGNESIPYYDQLLPVCPAQNGVPSDPCHMPGSESDAPGMVVVPCDPSRGVTNFCYTATVNGSPAPATLKVLAYLTAYKLHDTSVANAQLEANIVAYHVPVGAELARVNCGDGASAPRTNRATGARLISPRCCRPRTP